MDELTKEQVEQIKKHQRELQEKQQNEFASKVLQDIEWWCEKANKTDYKPTLEENEKFIQVLRIVNGMNESGLLAYIPE